MSEHAGEKTEAPTQKKLDDAIKHGNIARSTEVQTVAVLAAGSLAISITGRDVWDRMANAMTASLGHLHDTPINLDGMQARALHAVLYTVACVSPIALTVMGTGALMGAIQNRFQATPEALSFNWERVNPVSGFSRIFSFKSAAPAALSLAKMLVIGFFSWTQIREILRDPIFYQAVDASRIGRFMGMAARSLGIRVLLIIAVLAAIDYAYQVWRYYEDLRMTREEVKDESKQSEGNPQVKSAMRKRRGRTKAMRKQLEDVAKADVVLVNPTHIAVALHYDRKKMRAPVILAKGSRFNAQRIREAAEAARVPVIQNIPLARLMFKYGRVGSEIPSQLYAAVAEILAYVYRVNRYRYHSQQLQSVD